MSTIDQPARPGRKRSQASHTAILQATLSLVAEDGFAALSIEGIAARSRVGKRTIYRWWPSKGDVLLEALAETAELNIPVCDTGNYAGDLRKFVAASFQLGRKPLVSESLRALMAQAQLDVAFSARFRRRFLQPRRDALQVVLDQAQARGDLPPRPSLEHVADLVFGAVWYRVLATDRPLDDALADELVALLARPPTPEPATS